MRPPHDVGAVMVAVGGAAQAAAVGAQVTLKQHCPDLPVTVLAHPEPTDAPRRARELKLNLDTLAPYRRTLYLDADTRVRDAALMTGAQILADGFDLVIVPSINQGAQFLAHSTPDDAQATRYALGDPEPLQLQAGLFWVQWNPRTRTLWAAWRSEYGRHGDKDQGALLRALERHPVRLWLWGLPFNSYNGSIVNHQFGML